LFWNQANANEATYECRKGGSLKPPSGSDVATGCFVLSIERIRAVVKDGGMPLLLFRICHKLASPVLDFGSTIFFTIDLGTSQTHAPRKTQFVCSQACETDAVRLLDASDPSRTLEQVEERFRQGQMCFAAVNAEGRIVHTRWCAPAGASIGELSLDIQPSPGEIYVYDNYTRPEFRGLGAASELQVFVLEALASMGYSRIHAFVKGDNIPVLRAVKPPHRKTGRLFYLRFFGFNPIIVGRRTWEFPRLVIPGRGQLPADAFQYDRSDK
jgi:ribosomal protein S18 acetylase RimI-like enzyme